MCHLGIECVRVKTKLYAKIHFYVLPLVITIGWHGIGKGEVDFYKGGGAQVRTSPNWIGGWNGNVGHIHIRHPT